MSYESTYELLDRFVKESGIKRGTQPLKIFYGETVDEFGMTIDSLKYYFALAYLQHKLSGEATVVIADVASMLNDSAQEKRDRIQRSIDQRISLLQKIITVYRLPIGILLMSDIFETEAYKILRKKITSDGIEEFLKKTIPANKLEEEQKKDFRYSLDAVATALLFDVKIGPPRERFYDEAGEKIMPGKLKSIYLTPTQPLGKNFAFFLTHPEIEKYGVTPYKAGSNKLQDFRIILGETSIDKAKELVDSSFESDKKDTVHPMKDLYEITEMAREFLDKEKVSLDVAVQLEEYIYKPLELI